MSDRYVIEAMLRPAVELNTAVVAACASYICVTAPWAVALAPSVSYVTAAGFAVLAVKRTQQGLWVLRYRRNIRRLPRYVVTSSEVPVSNQRLFLGKGLCGNRSIPSDYWIPCARRWRVMLILLRYIRRHGVLSSTMNIASLHCANCWRAIQR